MSGTPGAATGTCLTHMAPSSKKCLFSSQEPAKGGTYICQAKPIGFEPICTHVDPCRCTDNRIISESSLDSNEVWAELWLRLKLFPTTDFHFKKSYSRKSAVEDTTQSAFTEWRWPFLYAVNLNTIKQHRSQYSVLYFSFQFHFCLWLKLCDWNSFQQVRALSFNRSEAKALTIKQSHHIHVTSSWPCQRPILSSLKSTLDCELKPICEGLSYNLECAKLWDPAWVNQCTNNRRRFSSPRSLRMLVALQAGAGQAAHPCEMLQGLFIPHSEKITARQTIQRQCSYVILHRYSLWQLECMAGAYSLYRIWIASSWLLPSTLSSVTKIQGYIKVVLKCQVSHSI